MKYNFVLLFQEHFSKDRSDIEEEVDHAEEGGYHEEDQADHFSLWHVGTSFDRLQGKCVNVAFRSI